MSREEILRALAEVASEHLEFRGELDWNAPLETLLALDSLRRLILLAEIENRFRVTLEPEDESSLETLGDLVSVLERKLEGTGSPKI